MVHQPGRLDREVWGITDGPVVGYEISSPENCRDEVECFLGKSLETIDKSGFLLTWLRSEFGSLPDNPSDFDILYHARSYMILLIGSIVFTNSSCNKVHYKCLSYLEHIYYCGGHSWRSAVLVNLYSELSKVALMEKMAILAVKYCYKYLEPI